MVAAAVATRRGLGAALVGVPVPPRAKAAGGVRGDSASWWAPDGVLNRPA